MTASAMEAQASLQNPRLPNTLPLTGFRGLLALVVFGTHIDFNRYLGGYDGLRTHFAVYCFFVISSFLLTFNCLAWKPKFATPSKSLRTFRIDRSFFTYWASYAVRRVFKIYPLYLVAVVLSASVPLFGEAYWNLVDFWPHLFMLENRTVLWSVAVEFEFYRYLPILVIIYKLAEEFDFRSSQCWRRLSVISLFSALSAFVSIKYNISNYEYLYPHFLPYYPAFWAGCLGGIILRFCLQTGILNVPAKDETPKDYQISFKSMSINVSAVANYFAWLYLLFLFTSQYSVLEKFHFNVKAEDEKGYRDAIGIYLAYPFTILVFMMLTVLKGKSFNKFFENSLLQFTGKIGYPFYLFHLFAMQIVSGLSSLSNFTGLVIIVSLTYLIAYAAYCIVEEPFIKLASKLNSCMKQKSTSYQPVASAAV